LEELPVSTQVVLLLSAIGPLMIAIGDYRVEDLILVAEALKYLSAKTLRAQGWRN
jgi:hypothetical protein